MKFRFPILFVVFFSISLPFTASAAAYLPGQTLNPSCPPTDPTCIVVPNTTSSNFTATSSLATSTFAGNVVISGNTVIGNLNGIVKAVAGMITTALVNLSSDVTGLLAIANGGTGVSSAPSYGQVLVGNNSGGYSLTSTSSLGISASGGTWGSITGTLTSQADLQSALNAKLSLSSWYATTTDALTQGGTNKYFSNALAQGAISVTGAPLIYSNGVIGIEQASSSGPGYLVSSDWTLFNNKVSSSSLSATYPLAYNSATGVFSNAFSTTSANTFSSTNIFNGSSVFGSATSTNFFSTIASTTNLYAQSASLGALTLGPATTTSGSGFNIITGCFSVNGTCLNTSATSYAFSYPLINTTGIVSLGFGTTTANTYGALQTFVAGASSSALTLGTGLGILQTNAAGLVSAGTVNLVSQVAGTLGQGNGGTGFNSYTPGAVLYADGSGNLQQLTSGSNGQVLKLAAGLPSWGVDLASGGGGGNDGIFATSSSGVIYPINTSSSVVIGSNSTSSSNSIFEVSGQSYFSNKVGIGSTTPSTTLSVTGSGYFTGGIGIGALNTGAGTLVVAGNTTLNNASSSGFAITSLSHSLLAVNANGTVVATSTLGNSLLQGGGALTLNGISASLGGTFTITAASSSHLSDNNTFSGSNVFNGKTTLGNSSSTLTTSGTMWLTGLTNSSLLSIDQNGKVTASTTIGYNLVKGPASSIFAFDNSGNPIATTSIGINYLSGTLGVANGGTGSTTLTGLLKGNGSGGVQTAVVGVDYLTSLSGAASSTILADNNTFAGTNVFTGKTTLGNASTSILSVSGTGYFTTASTTNLTLGTGAGFLQANSSGAVSATSTFSLVNNVFGTLGIGFGGTNNTSFSNGTLISFDGTKFVSSSTIATSQLLNDAGFVTSSFSTTSASYFLGVNQDNAFSTTSASNFLSLNKGFAFSTTSANYWKTQTTFTGASSTLLSDSNTFSGANVFSGKTTLGNASTTQLGISNSIWFTGLTNSILSTDVNGKVVATSSIGTNYLTGTVATVNSTAITAGGTFTITAASSTLLSNNNTFSGNNIFGNLLSLTSGFISNSSSTIVGNFTTTGNVIAGGTGTFASASTTLFSNSGTSWLTNASTSILSVSGASFFAGLASFGNASSSIFSASGTGFFGNGVFTSSSGTTTIASGQGFSIGGSQFLVQQGSGNVGIGTSTPTANLVVSGTTGQNYLQVASSTKQGILVLNQNGYLGLGTTTPGSLFSIAGIGNWTTATSSLYGTGGINLASGCFAVNGSCVSGSGGSNYFANSGSYTYLTTGSFLGIGTSTPLWPLTASSASGPQLSLTDTSASANAWTFRASSNNLYIATSTATATSSTPAITINQNGNVGIASSSPYAKLSVTGDTRIKAPSDSATALVVENSVGSSTLQVSTLNTSGDIFQVASSTGSIYFDITAAGTVGIGTSTPDANFSIYSLTKPSLEFSTGASGAQWTTGINTSNGNAFEIASSTALGTNARFIINGLGNVGIGTTTPGSIFSIANVGNWTTATSTLYGTGGINLASGCFAINGTCISGTGGGGSGTVSSGTQGQFAFYSAAGTTVSGTSTLSLSTAGALTFTGNLINYSSAATTTILNNTPYAWTIATSSTASPLFKITTTSGSENVSLGVPNSDIYIGDTNSSPNLVFQNSSTIKTLNGGILTFGLASDTAAFVAKVGVGTSTPYSRLEVWGLDTASTSVFSVINSASTTEFNVLGNGNATLAGNLIQNSDQRLKANITTLDGSTSLAKIVALNPVSFNWIDPAKSSTQQYGFIAQQVQSILPYLVSTTSPTALTPDGTLSLNYIDLISPIISAIQELGRRIVALETTIQNFANSFTTRQLCLTDANGVSCYTRSQLNSLFASTAMSSPSSGGSSGAGASGAETSTPPIIVLNGANPATITVGATYNDLGATITGPQQDLNLGIQAIVDGGATTSLASISIDTSVPGSHQITYIAIDHNGLEGTLMRTVNVSANSGTASSSDSTTTSSTSDTAPTDATSTPQ